MSTTLQANGKYKTTFLLPTGKRDAKNQIVYKRYTQTNDTKEAGERFERVTRNQHKNEGVNNILGASELAEYKEAKIITRNTDLREVAKFWAMHHPEGEVITCGELWEKYQDSKAWSDYAEKTQATKTYTVKKFLEDFEDVQINAVSVDVFEDWLESSFDEPVTRNTSASIIKTMFTWAASRKQKFIPVNQLKLTEREAIEYKEPVTIPVNKVQDLFDAAIEHVPAVVPFLAIQYFGGVRTEELKRIDGADIDVEEKRIFVRAGVAKGKGKGKEIETARIIENLPDTIWEWLKACDYNGVLDTTNFKDRIRKVYVEAGIKEEDENGKLIGNQRYNSLARHCFCSYAYAKFQDAGKVRKWSGHVGTDLIFRRHYAALKKQTEGNAYFDILPKTKIKNGIQRNLAGATKELDDETLLTLAKTLNNSQIAKAYGVSETAIRKRLKKLTH